MGAPRRYPEELRMASVSPRRNRPQLEFIDSFIDDNRAEFGVEPICQALTESGIKVAPFRLPGQQDPISVG